MKASFEDFIKFQEDGQRPEEAVDHDSLMLEPEEGTKKPTPSVPTILFLRAIDNKVRERELGQQDHI